jgi:SAM-dependent methyltransferase
MNMESNFIVPDLTVKYILLQRTELQRYQTIAKKLRLPYQPYISSIETFLRGEKIKQGLVEQISNEYEIIKPYLHSNVSRILDIGCGIAGIDILLYRHYGCSSKLDFFLLDKTEINKNVYYNLEKEATFYNSLQAAKLMLWSNGIDEKNIHLMSVTPDYQINVSNIDLVISLISWGFHYPISVYLNKVYDLLNWGGQLILDVRKGSNGEDELRQKFKKVELIVEDDKKFRFSLIKT